MARGHWHPRTCRVCGRGVPEVSNVSQQGFCPDHGRERMEANVEQLQAHHGPQFDHWRRRCIAAFGGIVPENLREPA